MCFNGVPATYPDGGQYCACNAGWNWDFALFHDKICTLPDVVHVAFFAVNLVLLVICNAAVIYFLQLGKARSSTRQAAQMWMAYSVFNFGMVASIYAENGWFHAASVFAIIAMGFCCIWGVLLISIFVFPLFKIEMKSYNTVKQGIYGTMTSFWICALMAVIPMLVFARTDDNKYNAGVMAYFGVMSMSCAPTRSTLTNTNSTT